ncbi:MAG: GTPase family protein [Roseinatronobacter sp.]
MIKPVKSLVFRFLRGGSLLSLVLIALPWLVLIVFGILWLLQNGYFLLFVLGTTVAIVLARLPVWLRRWQRARNGGNAPDRADSPDDKAPIVAENPDWTAREMQIYAELREDIVLRIPAPQPMTALPDMALEIAESAARKLSDGQKGALDFSVPEALLLADRIILRLRGTIRSTLPLADRISIGTLYWVWQNRVGMQKGVNAATIGWRLFRLTTAPVQAIVQEVQRTVLSGANDFLTNRSLLVLQRMILEEVAHASIELHSGRLRFSDTELLAIQLGSEVADRGALAQPDTPLRLLVIGQVSAGKSTLINALAGSELAETDMAPTTPGLTRHDIVLDGLPYHIIDTQGLDGGKATEETILRQMRDCDIVLWVVRANRPARAPDVALMERFRHAFASDHRRRKPPVVVAVSATDSLLQGWPYPEHILPDEDRRTVADLVEAVSRDLDARIIVPVCAEDAAWNVDVLVETIGDHATEAMMTQRNRRRLDGETQQARWAQEAGRVREGVTQTAGLIWSRIVRGNR